MKTIAAVLLLASGCTLWFDGGDDAPTAVPPDARIVPTYDAPSGPCGLEAPFAGKLVDIDATPSIAMPIAGAKLVARTGTSTGTTDATGTFTVCQTGTTNANVYDVDMPEPYADAIAVHDFSALRNALYSPTMFRAWTPTRVTQFYSEHGLVYDPTKAHVMVFVAGDSSESSLDRPHGTTFAAQEGYMSPVVLEWMAGSYGRYLWIPNVDASQPTGTFRGGPNPVEIPLVANKITFVVYSIVYVD